MKRHTLLSLLLLAALGYSAIVCAAAPAPSLDEVKTLLSKQLTLQELEGKLGKPQLPPSQNWGNISYPLPSGQALVFWYKGSFITEANYGEVTIKGVSPSTHSIQSYFDSQNNELVFSLNQKPSGDLAGLQASLKELPPGAIIEWAHSCRSPSPSPEQLKQLEELCLSRKLILIQYPAG